MYDFQWIFRLTAPCSRRNDFHGKPFWIQFRTRNILSCISKTKFNMQSIESWLQFTYSIKQLQIMTISTAKNWNKINMFGAINWYVVEIKAVFSSAPFSMQHNLCFSKLNVMNPQSNVSWMGYSFRFSIVPCVLNIKFSSRQSKSLCSMLNWNDKIWWQDDGGNMRRSKYMDSIQYHSSNHIIMWHMLWKWEHKSNCFFCLQMCKMHMKSFYLVQPYIDARNTSFYNVKDTIKRIKIKIYGFLVRFFIILYAFSAFG